MRVPLDASQSWPPASQTAGCPAEFFTRGMMRLLPGAARAPPGKKVILHINDQQRLTALFRHADGFLILAQIQARLLPACFAWWLPRLPLPPA